MTVAVRCPSCASEALMAPVSIDALSAEVDPPVRADFQASGTARFLVLL